MSNELQRRTTYIPAKAPERRPIEAYPITEYEPATLAENHLASLETVRETATPLDRAVAFGVRLFLLCVLWLGLAVGMFIFLEGDSIILPFGLFVALTAASYIWLDKNERSHSAAGIEIHKANLAHDLAVRKLEDDGARKDRLMDAYIRRMLED